MKTSIALEARVQELKGQGVGGRGRQIGDSRIYRQVSQLGRVSPYLRRSQGVLRGIVIARAFKQALLLGAAIPAAAASCHQ